MTPQEMATEAKAAMLAGTRLTMVRVRGIKLPPKFPRGELLCENHDGRNVYSYDPAKVIAWLNKYRLVAVEILTPNVEVTGEGPQGRSSGEP